MDVYKVNQMDRLINYWLFSSNWCGKESSTLSQWLSTKIDCRGSAQQSSQLLWVRCVVSTFVGVTFAANFYTCNRQTAADIQCLAQRQKIIQQQKVKASIFTGWKPFPVIQRTVLKDWKHSENHPLAMPFLDLHWLSNASASKVIKCKINCLK